MKVSNKRAKKVALKNMTPGQLRRVIRALKLDVKIGINRLAAARRDFAIQRADETRQAVISLQQVRDRAAMCRAYADSVPSTSFNLIRATCEYIPYGPLGDYPARNGGGIHPFKRWGLETPEERIEREEREEKLREEARDEYWRTAKTHPSDYQPLVWIR
jgi:hypothetical protein